MLELQSVTKTYPDGTTAVTGVDLVIPSDGLTVLVGPSGCGKTTLLRMINRMIEPTDGRILWDGEQIASMRKTTLRRQMGYVIQNGGLFPHRTVLENIGTVPELLGWDDNRTLLRSRQLLEQVGLETRLGKRFPAQLSGGQQQRVGVARALAADPTLLLMDEPFSAVDPVVRADLQVLVKDLQRELNKTIVMITHDMDEAITMGDRIAVLRPGGTVAQFGTPAEILDDPADDFVARFVGKDRGFRSLGFAEVPRPHLGRVRTVRNAESAHGSRDDEDRPVLVVDADGAPQGWADPGLPGRVLTLGETFTHPGAPLRDLVEAALTSPVGRAVAVGESGRYAGVLTSTEVMDQVRHYRVGVAEEQLARRIAAEGHPRATEAAAGAGVAPEGRTDATTAEERGGSTAAVTPGADETPPATAERPGKTVEPGPETALIEANVEAVSSEDPLDSERDPAGDKANQPRRED